MKRLFIILSTLFEMYVGYLIIVLFSIGIMGCAILGVWGR